MNRRATSLVLVLLWAVSYDAKADDPTVPDSADASHQDSATSAADARDPIFYPGDTESIKPLGSKLLHNIWLDQQTIWTSPFRMNRHNAGWWIFFSGATAALIATDHRTIHTFENSPSQVAWGNHISNIGSGYTLAGITAAFYGVGAWQNDETARETGVLGAEAMLDSLVVMEALKLGTGRVRPDSGRTERGDFWAGGDSFPSGHSIATWSLASVVAHEYKGHRWVPYVAYGLASTVSLSRFAAQRHYASDIVAGSAMGWFIGRYVYDTHEFHAGHQHAWNHLRFAPAVDPSTGTYAATVFVGN